MWKFEESFMFFDSTVTISIFEVLIQFENIKHTKRKQIAWKKLNQFYWFSCASWNFHTKIVQTTWKLKTPSSSMSTFNRRKCLWEENNGWVNWWLNQIKLSRESSVHGERKFHELIQLEIEMGRVASLKQLLKLCNSIN